MDLGRGFDNFPFQNGWKIILGTKFVSRSWNLGENYSRVILISILRNGLGFLS